MSEDHAERGGYGERSAPVRIVVRGIRGIGRHGLADTGERERPQSFVVDVTLVVGAPVSDDIDATIDYRDIAKAVRSTIEEESFELVETLADTIAGRVLKLGGDHVTVHVMKPDVARLMGVGELGVVVERP